jgi:hypothetical protein
LEAKVRKLFIDIFILTAFVGPSSSASAAGMCTSFIEFKGTQNECVRFIQNGAEQVALKANELNSTFFFWFGDNGVTARCFADHGLIALSSYHQQDNQACPLSDRVKNALRRDIPPR